MAQQGWRQNWSGHLPFARARVHQPATVAEVQRLVAGAGSVKVVGAGHSFTGVADTTGDLLWLGRLPGRVEIDRERSRATVPGGMTYGELAPVLHRAGFALPNLASLPHVTVVGACATATHGSGDGLGNLATAVSGLELVTADGERRRFAREADGDRFEGMVVSLGALGVVTEVTLDLVPAFELVQSIYTGLPWDDLWSGFDQVTSAGYSVSLFPTWQHPWVDATWVKRRVPTGAGGGDASPAAVVDVPDRLLGARWVPEPDRPPLPDRTRTGLNQAGPWHERLPHFTLTDPAAVGDELQSEYFVARADAVPALRAVLAMGPELAGVIDVSEIRTVAADRAWLSPAYGRDVVAIHVNWRKDWAGVSAVLPRLEGALAPFGPLPHWGKLTALPVPAIRAGYPRLADFAALAAELDPRGVFANDFVRRHLLD